MTADGAARPTTRRWVESISIRDLDRPEHGQWRPGGDAQARDRRQEIRDIAGLKIPLVEQVDEVEACGHPETSDLPVIRRRGIHPHVPRQLKAVLRIPLP